MRIVVTGTDERLGRILADKLQAREDDVVKVSGSTTSDHVPSFENADAVLCTAGCDPEEDETTGLADVDATVKAAQAAGVLRYIRVSANGAFDPHLAEPDRQPFLQSQHEAEGAVRAPGLQWTVVRPGTMTDDPETGRVHIQVYPDRCGAVSRGDVAEVVIALIDKPWTMAMVLELWSGTDPIDQAINHTRDVPPFLG
ncbi:MAG: NAD(P)H-binding protein [Ornithinimicrobium sp.]